jgi:hypothetical protein
LGDARRFLEASTLKKMKDASTQSSS